jgi:hypothetical protein
MNQAVAPNKATPVASPRGVNLKKKARISLKNDQVLPIMRAEVLRKKISRTRRAPATRRVSKAL